MPLICQLDHELEKSRAVPEPFQFAVQDKEPEQHQVIYRREKMKREQDIVSIYETHH
jgi:hypothetical protein